MFFIELETVASTNSWLAANADDYPSMTMVSTNEQTAGRGQRGNGWASEPGQNLTLSLLFRPQNVKPAQQFIISQATALAISATLRNFGIEAKVKWPNDIYVGQRKICGILIENSLTGMQINHSIIGIGLNVNQMQFPESVPNPVSMAMLTGEDYMTLEVRSILADNLTAYLRLADSPEGVSRIRKEYRLALWRGDNAMHPFRDTATSETFMARIEDIDLAGPIVLRDDNDRERRYWFKEVAFLPGSEGLAENIGQYAGGF